MSTASTGCRIAWPTTTTSRATSPRRRSSAPSSAWTRSAASRPSPPGSQYRDHGGPERPPEAEAVPEARDGHRRSGWRHDGPGARGTGSEETAGAGDRCAAARIPDGVPAARRGRVHARGDRCRARHRVRHLQGPVITRPGEAQNRSGRFCGRMDRMTENREDRFEQELKRMAQDYHRPPETPRDEMWARITAERARRRDEAKVVPLRRWTAWSLAAAA